MSKWKWTNRDKLWFSGVIYARHEDVDDHSAKHFYTGWGETDCGLVVDVFRPAEPEDATVTCPGCRNCPPWLLNN